MSGKERKKKKRTRDTSLCQGKKKHKRECMERLGGITKRPEHAFTPSLHQQEYLLLDRSIRYPQISLVCEFVISPSKTRYPENLIPWTRKDTQKTKATNPLPIVVLVTLSKNIESAATSQQRTFRRLTLSPCPPFTIIA